MEQSCHHDHVEQSQNQTSQVTDVVDGEEFVIELVGLPEPGVVVKEACVQLAYDHTTGKYELCRSGSVSNV